jgi:hypothetical protein
LIPGTTAPDIYGFAAVILMAASAIFIVFRGMMLKHVKNLSLLRALHVAVSTGAGLFLVLHVSNTISYPLNDGVIIGYVAFAMSVAVWLSGMAFIQRARDSLHFHLFLSLALISIILIHASAAGPNIPMPVSEVMIGGSSAVALADLMRYRSKLR